MHTLRQRGPARDGKYKACASDDLRSGAGRNIAKDWPILVMRIRNRGEIRFERLKKKQPAPSANTDYSQTEEDPELEALFPSFSLHCGCRAVSDIGSAGSGFRINAALPNAMDQQEEKKTKSYQSHDGVSGFSKSAEKLKCLRLPASLKGRTVLDLGCNEGFFSLEAKRRGAKKVIGIDRNEKALANARARAGELGLDVEFLCGDVADLPVGPFDYILLLSALHYIDDPAALFRRVRRALGPNGTLILECGIGTTTGATLQRTLRSIDDRMFPTLELLRDVWLKDFSVRIVHRSVDQVGDPIPRRVLHCQRRRTNVMLILGKGSIGKSILASQLRGQATINTDFLFSPLVNEGRHFYPEAQRRFDDEKRRQNGSIRRAWDALQNDPEVRRFMVDTLARAIRLCGECPLIVVEGYPLQNLEADLRQALGSEYRCWITRREEENSRVAGTPGAQDVPGVHTVPAGPRQLDSTREAK